MLSIHPTTPKQITPNLLPARINHNGPINNTTHHWSPETDSKGTQHIHFRGRHLYGTPLPLPKNYTGAALVITDKLAPQPPTQTSSTHRAPDDAGDDADGLGEDGTDADEMYDTELPEEVKIAEQIGEFEEIVVWGHGGVVDEEGDMYVRGLREWVGFAEAMHCDEDGDEVEGKTS